MFVNSERDDEDRLLREIRKLGNVEEAHRLHGVYDMVVKVRANTEKDLKEIMTRKIRKLENIRSTLTVVTRD